MINFILSNWYVMTFVIALVVFAVKCLISQFAGDADIDFDLDGDVDFDFSSILSFKGLLHFIIGFCGYLSLERYKAGSEFVLNGQAYMMAIFIGVILAFFLMWVYHLCLKLQSIPTDPSIYGMNCTVLTTEPNKVYQVQVKTHAGLIKKTLHGQSEGYAIGSLHKIGVDDDNNLIVLD